MKVEKKVIDVEESKKGRVRLGGWVYFLITMLALVNAIGLYVVLRYGNIHARQNPVVVAVPSQATPSTTNAPAMVATNLLENARFSPGFCVQAPVYGNMSTQQIVVRVAISNDIHVTVAGQTNAPGGITVDNAGGHIGQLNINSSANTNSGSETRKRTGGNTNSVATNFDPRQYERTPAANMPRPPSTVVRSDVDRLEEMADLSYRAYGRYYVWDGSRVVVRYGGGGFRHYGYGPPAGYYHPRPYFMPLFPPPLPVFGFGVRIDGGYGGFHHGGGFVGVHKDVRKDIHVDKTVTNSRTNTRVNGHRVP